MNIELQPFSRDDFTRLIGWIPSEEFLIQWSGPFFTYPLDEAQLEAYLQSASSQPLPRRIFKAVDRDSGQVLGHIELNNIDRRNQAATLSKVLVGVKALRGQGAGTQMCRRLLEIAFDEMHLHRVELKVFDWNEPAVHAYQNLGFTIEGHLRDYRKIGDIYWNSYLMAILESEWQGRKKS